jgi:hypothetical protein
VEICGVNTSKLKTLTDEEKRELLQKSQAGDGAARQKVGIGEINGIKKMRGAEEIGEMGVVQMAKTGATAAEKSKIERNERILTTPASRTRASVRDLRPGDILAARWEDEERNGTPGFWNHLAIVGTEGARVVEAQKSADGIVTAAVEDFLARYAEVVVFRFFDAKMARRAAKFAESRVAIETTITSPSSRKKSGKKEERGDGREDVGFSDWVNWSDGEEAKDWSEESEERRRLSGPRYSWSASLAPILRSDAATENCVSLVRRAFWRATGVDYRWKTPDDLARWDKSGDFARIGKF